MVSGRCGEKNNKKKALYDLTTGENQSVQLAGRVIAEGWRDAVQVKNTEIRRSSDIICMEYSMKSEIFHLLDI